MKWWPWTTRKETPKKATQAAAERFVEKLFKSSPEINIAVIPDEVEKQIYIKLICLLVGNMKTVLDGLKLDVLGHEITVRCEEKETICGDEITVTE